MCTVERVQWVSQNQKPQGILTFILEQYTSIVLEPHQILRPYSLFFEGNHVLIVGLRNAERVL